MAASFQSELLLLVQATCPPPPPRSGSLQMTMIWSHSGKNASTVSRASVVSPDNSRWVFPSKQNVESKYVARVWGGLGPCPMQLGLSAPDSVEVTSSR